MSTHDVSKVFSLDVGLMHACSRSLTTKLGGTQFQIELEPMVSSTNLVQSGMSLTRSSGHHEVSKVDMVFFRPVDGNLSHHTFLGEAFQSDFDFLAQVLSVVRMEKDSTGQTKHVVLGTMRGEPKKNELVQDGLCRPFRKAAYLESLRHQLWCCARNVTLVFI